jgi:hypothetical protein
LSQIEHQSRQWKITQWDEETWEFEVYMEGLVAENLYSAPTGKGRIFFGLGLVTETSAD